ncbi:MAG: hypothetical protein AB7H90_07420 [Alphaproteobacteria bacterium]
MAPRTFNRAVFSEWRRTVTGQHAAPYAVFAALAAVLIPIFALDDIEDLWIKIAVGAFIPTALLVTSIVAATRSAWIIERMERQKLADRLSPKILICGEDDDGVYDSISAKGEHFKYAQIIVKSATDAPLINCEVWVTAVYLIDRDLKNVKRLVDQPARCEWSGRNLRDNERALIPAGLSQRVRLFMMGETYSYPCPLFGMPNTVFSLEIETPGLFRITILVAADDTKSESKSFIFSWTEFDNMRLIEEEVYDAASASIGPEKS